MDISTISTIISTVGFPIAACIAMFWYINKQSDIHKQEVDKLSDALNNNTIALTKLADAIGGNVDDSDN